MNWFEAIILGLLQGLTEFLPVSSSGHLVLAQEWLGMEQNDLVFEVFVHFGTLLAVVLVFREDISRLLASLRKTIGNLSSIKDQIREDREVRLALFIFIGSLPAAIIGFFFADYYQTVFAIPFVVSWMLVVTGTILLLTRWSVSKHGSIRMTDAVMMGIVQALAIIPGISRSGSTIGAGLFLGLEKSEAARFSFLLSIPVILGATLIKSIDLANEPFSADRLLTLSLGTFVAFVSGYLSVRFLLSLIQKGKFSYFSYYCFLVGIAGIIYFA